MQALQTALEKAILTYTYIDSLSSCSNEMLWIYLLTAQNYFYIYQSHALHTVDKTQKRCLPCRKPSRL